MPAIAAKIGNLTRDPELRYSSNGNAYVRFGIAINPYAPEGEPEPEPEFYEVVAFHSLAEHASECLAKGQRVVVVGRGEIEDWTDRDGNPRRTKKIIADGIGPDLRFGTASFEKSERQKSARRDDTDDTDASDDWYDEEPF